MTQPSQKKLHPYTLMKFHKPLQFLYGGLLLAGLTSASHAAVYSQNFTFPDGTTNLGDGSSIQNAQNPDSNNTAYKASVIGGALELTSAAVTSGSSSFIVPAIINSSKGFTATFDVFLQDTAGGASPADGFSFTYGNTFALNAIFGEEGPGGTNSLSWVIDTWDNGVGDQGIRNKINGADGFKQSFVPLSDGGTVSTSITLTWHPTNGMSMNVAALGTVFSNYPTAGFTGGDDYLFGFGARTGGATETVRIDNLVITTVPEPTAALLAGLGGLGAFLRRRRVN